MLHVVVQTRFVLDDSPDIPRLVTRGSRMVRPPSNLVQALWHVNLEQATSGKLRPSNEFEPFTARSDCTMGGPCRVIGGSVRIQGSWFVNPIHRNRELADPPPIAFRT
jgi:hypothetical protein